MTPFRYRGRYEEFTEAFTKQVAAELHKLRDEFISPRNAQRFSHGRRWKTKAMEQIDDAGELQPHSFEFVFRFHDVVNHDLAKFVEARNRLIGGMMAQFLASLYQTINQSAERTGNAVVISSGQSLAEAFLAALEMIEFGVDENGEVSLPQVHMEREPFEKTIADLKAQGPEFIERFEQVKAKKSELARQREIERRAKFPPAWERKRLALRVLIAVGCDAYHNPPLQPLSGAENDAATIFEHLVAKNWGEYDQAQSKLLRSPTMTALRSTIEAALFSGHPVEELTFFFAGHGSVKDNSYFLCLKDTDVGRMSLSALSMTELFGWMTEAKIRHTNLIIDACHAGGVVHDIGVLLNPNVIGKVASLAISILAAAGSDEYAGESDGMGHCTSVLMSCLKGETLVQTTRPSLDLVEIGQVVSRAMLGTGQSPVSWGINLFGISQLAKNPRFSGGSAHISETFPGLAADGAGNDHIRVASDAIWEQYLSLTREFDAERFLDVVQPVCANLENEPEVAVAFIMGLATTFGARLAATGDHFDVARLRSGCAVALLPMAASSTHCANAILQLSNEVVASIAEGTDQLLVDLTESTYALLSKDGGIADFYFLPLRLISILGWLGAAVHIQTISGGDTAVIAPKAADLVRLIMAHYSNSFVPVSDEMTPFYVSFAAAADVLGCEEELELISGLLLRILHQRGGWIADPGLSGADALRFLTAVADGRCDDFRNILANPTSLLPAVLLIMDRWGLADIADGAMKGFDRINMNIFVPGDFSTFGAGLIEDGTNLSLNIGTTVFSVSDLVAEWSKIEMQLSAAASLASPAVRISCVLASLLRPDRIAWFLLAGPTAKSS